MCPENLAFGETRMSQQCRDPTKLLDLSKVKTITFQDIRLYKRLFKYVLPACKNLEFLRIKGVLNSYELFEIQSKYLKALKSLNKLEVIHTDNGEEEENTGLYNVATLLSKSVKILHLKSFSARNDVRQKCSQYLLNCKKFALPNVLRLVEESTNHDGSTHMELKTPNNEH